MSRAVAEILRRARMLIDTEEKWGKGPETTNGMCAWNACWVVERSLNLQSVRSLKRSIGLPDEDKTLTAWNDAPERTHAEVMDAFDRAIAAEEASD